MDGVFDMKSVLAGASHARLHEVIVRRRDVRREFTGAPVDPAVLARVLAAAHSAPSVGLSQPWDLVVVDDPGLRRAFSEHVQAERAVFAGRLTGERARLFQGMKVDGVLESSLSVVVSYDPDRGAPEVLGRHAIADAGIYSVAWRSRTCGWRRPPRAWGWGGYRFTGNPSLPGCSVFPRRSGHLRGCSLGRSVSLPLRLNWNEPDGATAARSRRPCIATAGNT